MQENNDKPLACRLDNLSRLDVTELKFLLEWCRLRSNTFPIFSKWLCETAVNELGRRGDPSVEATMICLPDLNGIELSDFLTGSYVLSRNPMTESLGKFIDQICVQSLTTTTAILETYFAEASC